MIIYSITIWLLVTICKNYIIDFQDSSRGVSVVPFKSPNDARDYEAVILPNNMKVLFINSKFITKSTSAISVGVGSMYNPERSLGLAHFLQHMLFMGSVKFPEQNSYASFIKTNSGSRNAYTSDTETNFYFQIKNSAFLQAGQRLINFFSGPLLKSQSIQKQRQAVQQQFALRVSDDNRRKWQILRQLALPPFSRFGTGNFQTLNHEYIRDDLVQFYNSYYSSNLMSAVIYSNYSIEQMKNFFIPLLQQIPNKNVVLPELGPHFTTQQLGKFVRMQSIKDKSILQFFWVLQFLTDLYQYHVSEYISHVLGHQGINSLFSILKSNKLASQIISQISHLKTQSILSLQIKLTQKGQQRYAEVYSIVVNYISSLKAEDYIYQQIKQKNMIGFQFQQKIKAPDYARRLAAKMHVVPLNHILNSSVVFQQYKNSQQQINRIISQINPANSIVILSSNKKLQNAQQDKFFGVKFVVEDLPDIYQNQYVFDPLPANPYVPIETTVHKIQKATMIPQKINQNFYLLLDSAFGVCKGGIQIRIYSQESMQFIRFYAKYLTVALTQITYPAETLSTSVEFDGGDSIVITIFGYSDTAVKVLKAISQRIKNTFQEDNQQRFFDLALKDLVQAYKNFYNRKADAVAEDMLDILLTSSSKSPQSYIEQLNSYTHQDLIYRIRKFWQNNILKWIVVGNFQEKSIKSLIAQTQNKLKGRSKIVRVPPTRCLKLQRDLRNVIYLNSKQLGSSATIVYYEAGPYSQDLFYKLQLLKNFIDEPYFSQLRTTRQLAYTLGVSIQNTRGILGLKFSLVSSSRDPKNISQEIKSFVNKFFGSMKQRLSAQNTLQKIKKSVFTQIQAPLNNIKSLFYTIIKQIRQKTLYFNRKKQSQINKYLNPVKISDLQNIWNNMKGKTLQVYVVSQAHRKMYDQRRVYSHTLYQIKQKSTYWDDKFQCCTQ